MDVFIDRIVSGAFAAILEQRPGLSALVPSWSLDL